MKAGLAQPEPDPAPVPKPAPAPAPPPAPEPTEATESPQRSERRPAHAKKRTPPKPERREQAPAQIDAVPAQRGRVEAGPLLTAAPAVVSRTPSVAPAPTRSAAQDRPPSAAGMGLLLLLASVILALAFAAIPERMLSTVSVRLAESRQEIGLALVVATAAGALISIILLEAGS